MMAYIKHSKFTEYPQRCWNIELAQFRLIDVSSSSILVIPIHAIAMSSQICHLNRPMNFNIRLRKILYKMAFELEQGTLLIKIPIVR